MLFGHTFDLDLIPPLLLTLLLMGVLGVLFVKQKSRKSITFGIVACSATMALGALSMAISQPKNLPGHYSQHDLNGNHIWQLKVAEVLKPSSFASRYIISVQSFDLKKTTGKLLLEIPTAQTPQPLQVDDELSTYTAITAIRPPQNPHQFDYQSYMADLGITYQMKLQVDSFILEEHPNRTIYGRTAAARNAIISKLKAYNFGAEELGITQALLLGQRNDISDTTNANYRNAGAMHILALSGLHIGILLLLLEFLFKPLEQLPRGRTVKLLAIVVLLWGFALLAGFSASIVRAVTMFSFVAYARFLNRPGNTFNILALSMFFILLAFDPKLLFHVGFQMSYAAVFAIVWIYPMLQKFWAPKNRLVKKLWQLLSVSMAAQLGVLPISLFYFHQFPGLFFVSNLLVVPFLGLILGVGIVVIVLALFGALPEFLVTAYNTLIALMNTAIEWVARQEAFIFTDIPFDGSQLLLAYTVIISFLALCSKVGFKRTATFLLAVIGLQLWGILVSYRAKHKEALFLAHQTRNTVIMYQAGIDLSVFSSYPERTKRLTSDYKVAERIAAVHFGPVQNSYTIKDKKLMVIDSLGVYLHEGTAPDYLLLTQSPKVNLERMVDSLRPKAILADGSNYSSDVARWSKTCRDKGLPFHFTGDKGAYYFELGD